MPKKSNAFAALSSALGLLLAGQLLSGCDPADSGNGSEPDFNPLPDSAEYVFAKEMRISSSMSPRWDCADTVYRRPLQETRPSGTRRFLDSTTANCTVVDFDASGTGKTDTLVVSRAVLDTLSFAESPEALVMTGADAFLNVAFPAGILSRHPDGLRRTSNLVTSTIVSFPKRGFPVVRTPTSQDEARDCGYTQGSQTTPCRKLYDSDFRYTSESLVFLQDAGFISLESSHATAPLGMGSTESGSIRLLYRILKGDTLKYAGSIQP